MLTASKVVPGSYARIDSVEECRPELRQLHDLWQALRGERRMPARRDFDPADARRLLPHIMLIDVVAEAPRERRYRVRLHGTAQAAFQGTDWTGAYLHEKTDRESAERLCDVGDHIVASRAPWMSTGSLYWTESRPYSRFETMLLPFR